MDTLGNIGFYIVFVGLLGVISEFFMFGYYVHKDRHGIHHFIKGEKQKALIGLVIGAGMLVCFLIETKSVWYPLSGIAFSIGIFAVAKYKERQIQA